MLSIDVAIFSRNRPRHFELCAGWLVQSEDSKHRINFICYDDSSESEETRTLQQAYFEKIVSLPRNALAITPEQRIGFARKYAVDQFLKNSKADFLLLLDSDILVTKSTISAAVDDYCWINEMVDVGGMTLHALSHICGLFLLEGKRFGYVSLTGDAHMLFRRDHLYSIGNRFGTEEKAFADTQIKAILESGRKYITRIDPVYEVQHIGFGEGASTIYGEETKQPSWVSRPYWSNFEPRRIIPVRNFDVLYYVDCVSRVGGANAPEAYIKSKGINP